MSNRNVPYTIDDIWKTHPKGEKCVRWLHRFFLAAGEREYRFLDLVAIGAKRGYSFSLVRSALVKFASAGVVERNWRMARSDSGRRYRLTFYRLSESGENSPLSAIVDV